ncbi:efflux transporter outer membrane subunit [Rivibacter subsaxonicus]|uniref:NodT family efflux transporter outer membrane factor (OMF) lipoprotein n=1 Tax=Rivibacter subsaxonicus TaxID=457575 RepID=A0A4Q7VNS1_9BURK|nr:TolC family protein [Rivibacter subsaxonicus]RZT97778.1 NodT family efflux transporter outer membrane factor (OMF) lipoprotein [Rivibacter subsaxonicus]
MATELRPNADDFVHSEPYADTPSNPDKSTPMSPPSTTALPHMAGQNTVQRVGRPAGLVALAALTAAIALVFSGCATPISRTTVDVPAQFAANAAAEVEPEAAWWASFHDPVLADLVHRAALGNRDVRIAAERLHAARAGVTVSRSFLMPSVSAVGSAGDRSSGYGNAVKQLVPDTKTASAGLDVSWEVDLSGRLRAGAAAAAADALAAEHGVRGVRLLVMTDVASNYFTLVGAQRQLDTLRAISAAHDETLRLVKARQRAGLATSFDVERAQTEAESARAQIPPLETIAAVSRHRIAVLIGDQAFNAGRIETWRGDVVVPEAQPGQPATLLQRRPDVLALMAQLDAANARRQQAAAEWFPRLFLDASFGRQNVELNSIGLGAARYTNVAALLAMPIFNAGRTRALNDAAESGQREAVLRAEDGMVRALEDVENALVALSSERQRSQSLQAAAGSAEAALGRAQSLYNRGQIDLLPLLDAQRSRLAVSLSANDSSTRLLLDSVQLYKALGGGWQVFEPDADTAKGSAMPPAAASTARPLS